MHIDGLGEAILYEKCCIEFHLNRWETSASISANELQGWGHTAIDLNLNTNPLIFIV